jgi:quercetin dioxygenase-like cupin family protein
MSDETLRRALWASVFYNAGGTLLFLFPDSLGRLAALPLPVPRVYTTLLATFVALFGGAYAWLARQPRIDAPMVALTAIGKAGAFFCLFAFWLAGSVSGLAVLAIAGDLVFAALFATWLLAPGRAVVAALVLLVPLTALGAEPTNPAAASLESHIMLAPADMKWEDCSSALPPGAKCVTIEGDRNAANVLFTYRVKIPDGYRIAPHFHPADEHLTVIAGTFNMGMGDRLDVAATKPMPAGSFMVMPKGTHHFAWARGETVIQVHAIGPWGITYVNPADDPRRR